MARPRKNANLITSSISEQIISAEMEIEALETKIHKARKKLKDLQKKKTEQDNSRILNAVSQSGKTIDEIIAMINRGEPQFVNTRRNANKVTESVIMQ